MADVFESIAAEVIGTMILGAALAHEARLVDPEPWIFFPLIIHALDLLISSVGVMLTMPSSDKEDPLTTMKRAYGVCMVLAAIGFAATCRFMLYTPVAPQAWWYYTLCGWIGIAMSFVIIRSTQYYTGQHRRSMHAKVPPDVPSRDIPLTCFFPSLCLCSCFLQTTTTLP